MHAATNRFDMTLPIGTSSHVVLDPEHRMWYVHFSWSRKFHCYLALINSVGLVIIFERKWPHILTTGNTRCVAYFSSCINLLLRLLYSFT